jgi:hypothetical protein
MPASAIAAISSQTWPHGWDNTREQSPQATNSRIVRDEEVPWSATNRVIAEIARDRRDRKTSQFPLQSVQISRISMISGEICFSDHAR